MRATVSNEPLMSAQQAARFLAAHGCTRLVTDSRSVVPGDGFLAWKGATSDARRFVPQAFERGAAACVVEDDDALASFAFDYACVAPVPALKALAGDVADAFYGAPSARLDVLAVTGTNGKTSSSWWLAQALGALGVRAGVIGTLGIGEADEGRIEATGLTTPDAVRVQAALAEFVARGFGAAAMEASSIGLVDDRMNGVRVAVALFTNFTQDHLDVHGDMATYWAAKRRLFDWPGLRAAVVNVDDAAGARLADELAARSGLDLWTVSRRGAPHRAARLAARGLRHLADGVCFELVESDAAGAAAGAQAVNQAANQAVTQAVTVVTRLIGDYNASNLLGVAAALRALGHPLERVAAALSGLAPVPGRLQPVEGAPTPEAAAAFADAPTVLIDYAHTPDALEQVLGALRPFARARGGALWCVFGCGGNRDAGKRPVMGALARRLADHVIVTSDNPRLEDPAAIVAQVADGARAEASASTLAVEPDRAAAIHRAVRAAAAADVVLLAGKGHEPYQDIGGEKHPFLDAAVARAALAARVEAVA